MSTRREYRWRIGIVAASVLTVLGLLYSSRLLITSTIIPLTYVIYGLVSTVPHDASLKLERRIENSMPSFGQPVNVELTVTNTCESTLSDLRIIDDVPDQLTVVDGDSRGSFSLRPGESAKLCYSVIARKGEFTFDAAFVRLRSLSATTVLTQSVPVDGDDRLLVTGRKTDMTGGLDPAIGRHSIPVDTTGGGLEFSSTREYRSGDPINRINWRHFAKTNELTTVSYLRDRAVRTVLVIDVRPPGNVVHRQDRPTLAASCSYAGEYVYEILRQANIATDVTALGIGNTRQNVTTGSGVLPWVNGNSNDSDSDATQLFKAVRNAIETTVTDQPDREPTRYDAHSKIGRQSEASNSSEVSSERSNSAGDTPDIEQILARVPPEALIVYVTPLLDDWPIEFVRSLRETDHPVTLLIPVPDLGNSLGGALVHLERDIRQDRIKDTGATIIPWIPDKPLDVILAEFVKTHGDRYYG